MVCRITKIRTTLNHLRSGLQFWRRLSSCTAKLVEQLLRPTPLRRRLNRVIIGLTILRLKILFGGRGAVLGLRLQNYINTTVSTYHLIIVQALTHFTIPPPASHTSLFLFNTEVYSIRLPLATSDKLTVTGRGVVVSSIIYWYLLGVRVEVDIK
ncbi:hypothetical protein EDD18DRAFT_1423657 [Armillaria luteobubalina]|uniref:Uncharacterized protein n=1 Tax=Armillaria luteobubalina TaxID=153913 RepID=A0AA39PQ13_9AGAR|nr:hypothetical protein EDD18DRAFT_1423657 [Armillaria luteobubalina]